MAKEVFIEEVELKRIGNDEAQAQQIIAYRVVTDGKRSDLYFYQRAAQDAAEAAAQQG